MNDIVLDQQIQDLAGIGPTTARKLREAGIETVLDLAAALPQELADETGTSRDTISNMVMCAQRSLMDSGLLEKEFTTGEQLLERRKNLQRCITGSKNLDALFEGGLETQAITEFAGEFGSGKSQICHTICVTSQLPEEQGGLNSSVIFIDTENTFRPERIHQIATGRGLDPVELLKKIFVCKIYNSNHLEIVLKGLGKYIEQYNSRLIIVDSLISLHRAEYVGRGTLAERQQRLNAMIHRLLRFAEIYNCAIIVTNQVQTKPDTFFGDPTRIAGGNVLAHASTYRILLRKSSHDRIAIMLDSPCHPYGDTRFTISEKGIEDPEQKKSKGE